MTVHNHQPYRPVCNERRVNGQLRGACLTDEGDPVSDTKPDLDAIEARANSATPGAWERRTAPREGVRIADKAEYMRGTATDNGEPLHVLISESPDPSLAYVVPAITGDGPTSEANAEFIAHAREDVPALVAYARTLEAENERLRDGADDEPREEHSWPTPAQSWAELLAMTTERRLEILEGMLDGLLRSGECFVADHEGRIDHLEAERDQLRDTLEKRSAAHNWLAQRIDQVREWADHAERGGVMVVGLRDILDGDQRTEGRA